MGKKEAKTKGSQQAKCMMQQAEAKADKAAKTPDERPNKPSRSHSATNANPNSTNHKAAKGRNKSPNTLYLLK
jgi:hypothetical protein